MIAQPGRRAVARAVALTCAVVATGLAAGLVGIATTWVLDAVQCFAFGVEGVHGSLLDAVAAAPPWQRVAAPALGCALAGLGWWGLRARGRTPSVGSALAPGRLNAEPDSTTPRNACPAGPDITDALPWWRSCADAALQLVAVGAGASLGREGAPRLVAASAGASIARLVGLDAEDARWLVAAAAGAGLAAVYNVPLAGVVFAAEVLLRWSSWRGTALAVPVCALATVTAWPVVSPAPTYRLGPLAPWVADPGSAGLWLAAAAVTAAVGVPVGCGFRALAVGSRPAPGWRLVAAVAAAGAGLGAALVWLPELAGNGKDVTQLALDGGVPAGVAAAVLLVKPLVTALFLRAGAEGGLLTPAIATGAMVGVLVAAGASALGQPVDAVACALIGAAVVLAVTQRAPVFGAVMVWELAHAPIWTLPLLGVLAWGAACAATPRGGSPDRVAARRATPGRG